MSSLFNWENLIIVFFTVGLSITAFDNPRLQQKLILYPYGLNSKNAIQIIGHGFIHADYMHLVFNMFTLFFFGGLIALVFEGLYGPFFYILFYLAAIVFSALPTILIEKNNPSYLCLGASGAVNAVLFAYVFLAPWSKVYIFGAVGIDAIFFAVFYLIYSMFALRLNNNINHNAHIAGAVFGFIVMAMIIPNGMQGFVYRLTEPF